MKNIKTLLAGAFLGALILWTGLYFAPSIHERGGRWLHRKISRPFADTLIRLNSFKKLAWNRKQEIAALQKQMAFLQKKANRLVSDLATAEKFLRPEVSLKGSPQALIFQNYKAEREDLARAKTKKDLNGFKKQSLVKLTTSKKLKIDPKHVKSENQYCRPWTRDCLYDLAKDFYEEFDRPIVITSLFRTEAHHKKLGRVNANAAGAHISIHPTGAAVDLKKRGYTGEELHFIRNWLLSRERVGMLEATEEHIQPNFHVMVYQNYQPIN